MLMTVNVVNDKISVLQYQKRSFQSNELSKFLIAFPTSKMYCSAFLPSHNLMSP